MKINWSLLLKYLSDENNFRLFANGKMSGRQLYAIYVHTAFGGYVRKVLREVGVDKFRELAKRRLAKSSRNATV